MITIEDYDSPITAAQKIIHGLTGKDMSEENYMFSVEEIKEIADRLMVYYNAVKMERSEQDG